MSLETEQAQSKSERMKALWASGKMGKKKKNPEAPTTPTGSATVPSEKNTSFTVPNSWQGMPIQDAQAAISMLKKEYDRAAHILNQRLMEPKFYDCFICGTKMQDGQQRGVDFTSTDKKTGLLIMARFCSEQCWEKHRKNQIEEKLKATQRS